MATLKIFKDEPVIVYVDLSFKLLITLLFHWYGNHYVQALNDNVERVYSEIVTHTTAPMKVKAYSSGALEQESKSRNPVISDYNYGKTFDENYYKK